MSRLLSLSLPLPLSFSLEVSALFRHQSIFFVTVTMALSPTESLISHSLLTRSSIGYKSIDHYDQTLLPLYPYRRYSPVHNNST
jgi:hypothetical protein